MRMLLVVLLFCVSVFARDEIGSPYVSMFSGRIDSTVLAPDGKSFYTLKDGLVTQWQLSPINKITFFKIGIKGTSKDKGYQISVTNDNKGIIIYSREEIQLWDIKSKKLLKTLKEKSHVGANSKYGFVTLSENNLLKIWDEKSLTLLKKTKIEYKYAYGEHGIVFGTKAENMIVGDNILLLSYLNGEAFFDLNTFEVVDRFIHDTDSTSYFYKYREKFTCELKSFLKGIPRGASNSFYISQNKIDKRQRNELVLRTNRAMTIFVKIQQDNAQCDNRVVIKFRQYDDAWLLYRYEPKMYMGSENIKKYLKMKTKSGEIIPMNDATFQKYNRQIKLKD